MRVGKARRQGSQRTPRGAERTHHTPDTIPTRKSVRGSRRSGLRVDPAGLNFPTPTNTHPRHHKKPHNPNPPHTRHTPFPPPTPSQPATTSQPPPPAHHHRPHSPIDYLPAEDTWPPGRSFLRMRRSGTGSTHTGSGRARRCPVSEGIPVLGSRRRDLRSSLS